MKPELEGYEKGQETELGAVNVMTGIYTGRSPKDKFIVEDGKEVKANNAAMGETVSYKLTSTLSDMNGYEKYTYIIQSV